MKARLRSGGAECLWVHHPMRMTRPKTLVQRPSNTGKQGRHWLCDAGGRAEYRRGKATTPRQAMGCQRLTRWQSGRQGRGAGQEHHPQRRYHASSQISMKPLTTRPVLSPVKSRTVHDPCLDPSQNRPVTGTQCPATGQRHRHIPITVSRLDGRWCRTNRCHISPSPRSLSARRPSPARGEGKRCLPGT